MTASTLHPRAELALTYRNAAKVVQARGLAKSRFEEPDGAVCAVGALRVAAGTETRDESNPVANAAVEFLSARLWVAIGDPDPVERVAEWNDHPNRVTAEVVAAFLAAAGAVDAAQAGVRHPAQMRTSDGSVFELASVPRGGEAQYVLAGCHGAPPAVFAEYGELVDGFGAVPMGGAA